MCKNGLKSQIPLELHFLFASFTEFCIYTAPTLSHGAMKYHIFRLSFYGTAQDVPLFCGPGGKWVLKSIAG